MRPALAYILAVVVGGLILGAIGRVLVDAVGWYKDNMTDPYRELRKNAQGTRKPRKTLEEIVNENQAVRRPSPEDNFGNE